MSLYYLNLVQDLQKLSQQYLSQTGLRAVDYSLAFLTLIGVYKVFRAFCVMASFFKANFIRPMLQSSNRMYNDYAAPGKDSWALITGGSDGIGLEMCHNLAGQGFNICIVSRN